jgi:hypothetical protein
MVMEIKQDDRRAPGVNRIPHGTLVEICGREEGSPVFEAESVNLSGRGMQVQGRYLPEVGEPLVLRFEHDGQPAVIEGQVAWREEAPGGGEFGIKFTALDSQSVRVLRALMSQETRAAQQPPVKPTAPAEQDDELTTTPGARVNLHLEGLAAPMKARIFEADGKRLHVGSQLEFLKMGRSLELEDLEAGVHRAATIDDVSVTLDPQTQVPQLVVSLRYRGGQDQTPEPSVVDQADDSDLIDDRRPSPDEDEYDPDYELDQAENMFKGRLETWASGAGKALHQGGVRLGEASGRLVSGLAAIIKKKRRGVSSGSKTVRAARRSTAPGGSTSRRQATPRARGGSRQRGRRSPAPTRTSLAKNPRVWATLAAVVVFSSGAYAVFGTERKPPASAPVVGLPLGAPTSLALATAVTPGAVAVVRPVGVPGASAIPGAPVPSPALASALASAVPVPGASALAPGQFPQPAILHAEEQSAGNSHGIVASVPLFGPQQMATTEPAPLQPPKAHVVDEYSMAKDLSFASAPPSLSKTQAAARQADSPSAEPSGDTVWQVGRMRLPIVHRLRLDGPGTALSGTKKPTGFSVLIPGRKVMESGHAIAKRDDRITDVRVANTPAGGTVSFRFRKEIPSYKVRLRKDYVEFFINSPASQ